MTITTSNYYTDSTCNRLPENELVHLGKLFNKPHKTASYFRAVKKVVVITVFMITTSLIIGSQLAKAVTKHIESQDIMLCESAKISGNEEWLKRCECYYKLEDIRCLGVIEK